MTACQDKLPLLNALIDGELDAANAAALDAHVADCPGCADELAVLDKLRRRIAGTGGLAHVAPDALRARIEAIAPARASTASLPAAAPARRRGWGWAGGALGGALAASLAFAVILPQASDHAVEDEVIASHVRSMLPGRLIDIQTSNRHVVKPWFNGRIDFAPPVVDLADKGFPLIGGRLDYLAGRNVAALAFHRERHVINLMILPAKPGWLPRGPLDDQRDGYHILRWRQGDLEFWAISDTDPAALHAFSAAYIDATR